MEDKVKLAKFRFDDYRITSFSYTDIGGDNETPISIDITPSGEFYKSEKHYLLFVNFTAYHLIDDKPKEVVVKAKMECRFVFFDEIEQVPNYFYTNCLAIAYPYLRSFISAITTLGNSKSLIMPIMNLSGLSDYLIEHTKYIDKEATT